MKQPSIKNLPLSAALTTVAAAVLFASTPVYAEGMGYVDVGRLVSQSPQGQDQSRELEEEFAERNRALQGRLDLYRSRQEDLEKNRLLLTEEEQQNKSEDLRELDRQLRRAQREFDEDFTRRRNQRLRQLEALIAEAVIEVAKREQLDVVFQQAVYASPEIDLTDAVLEELRERHQQ